MSLQDRAAQFSPFAALTGFDGIIGETGRQTQSFQELTDSSLEELNGALRYLAEHIALQPEVELTWFRPDDKKAGGAYLTLTGRVKKLDEYEHVLILTDGKRIPFACIYKIRLL